MLQCSVSVFHSVLSLLLYDYVCVRVLIYDSVILCSSEWTHILDCTYVYGLLLESTRSTNSYTHSHICIYKQRVFNNNNHRNIVMFFFCFAVFVVVVVGFVHGMHCAKRSDANREPISERRVHAILNAALKPCFSRIWKKMNNVNDNNDNKFSVNRPMYAYGQANTKKYSIHEKCLWAAWHMYSY